MRDIQFIYEDINGAAEDDNKSLRHALCREPYEKIGADAQIEIGDSAGIYHVNKVNLNWGFAVFWNLFKWWASYYGIW